MTVLCRGPAVCAGPDKKRQRPFLWTSTYVAPLKEFTVQPLQQRLDHAPPSGHHQLSWHLVQPANRAFPRSFVFDTSPAVFARSSLHLVAAISGTKQRSTAQPDPLSRGGSLGSRRAFELWARGCPKPPHSCKKGWCRPRGWRAVFCFVPGQPSCGITSMGSGTSKLRRPKVGCSAAGCCGCVDFDSAHRCSPSMLVLPFEVVCALLSCLCLSGGRWTSSRNVVEWKDWGHGTGVLRPGLPGSKARRRSKTGDPPSCRCRWHGVAFALFCDV